MLVGIPAAPILATTANGGHVASTTGADILFTDASGLTKINYERESYASTTGQLVAWVQVPSLSPTTDTVLYMYYGNSTGGLADQRSASATWDSSYKGVYHLPNGVNLSASDSTTVNNGTISSATAATGQVDGAASFGGAAKIDFGCRRQPVHHGYQYFRILV